jgi:hypothetical protein
MRQLGMQDLKYYDGSEEYYMAKMHRRTTDGIGRVVDHVGYFDQTESRLVAL